MTTEGCVMTLTQQWGYGNLRRNSFYILFSTIGIVSYKGVISSVL